MKPVERVDRITALIDEVLDVGQQQEGREHGADWVTPWFTAASAQVTRRAFPLMVGEVDGRGYSHGVYYPRALSAEEINALHQAGPSIGATIDPEIRARVLAYYELRVLDHQRQGRIIEITEA